MKFDQLDSGYENGEWKSILERSGDKYKGSRGRQLLETRGVGKGDKDREKSSWSGYIYKKKHPVGGLQILRFMIYTYIHIWATYSSA